MQGNERREDVREMNAIEMVGPRHRMGQGWICRLPGARENITVCGVAPVPASTHRVS